MIRTCEVSTFHECQFSLLYLEYVRYLIVSIDAHHAHINGPLIVLSALRIFLLVRRCQQWQTANEPTRPHRRPLRWNIVHLVHRWWSTIHRWRTPPDDCSVRNNERAYMRTRRINDGRSVPQTRPRWYPCFSRIEMNWSLGGTLIIMLILYSVLTAIIINTRCSYFTEYQWTVTGLFSNEDSIISPFRQVLRRRNSRLVTFDVEKRLTSIAILISTSPSTSPVHGRCIENTKTTNQQKQHMI